jgi:transposase InsO family protein
MMVVIHRNRKKGIIFHSDRGSQFTSGSFRRVLKNFGIVQSMSSTGNCYDNAITESFFHTLKTELTYWKKYQIEMKLKEVFLNTLKSITTEEDFIHL